MNAAERLPAIERGDHPLDLAPVAEGQDIAGLAAVARAGRGDQHGLLAEMVDQRGRVVQRRAAMDVREVHGRTLNPAAVAPSPIERVNTAFTMVLADRGALCQAGTMSKPDPRAGGFLLSLIIIIGLVVGIGIGSPMAGVLGGTAVGIAVALFAWLADRREPRA